jgi:hypothetical protein
MAEGSWKKKLFNFLFPFVILAYVAVIYYGICYIRLWTHESKNIKPSNLRNLVGRCLTYILAHLAIHDLLGLSISSPSGPRQATSLLGKLYLR